MILTSSAFALSLVLLHLIPGIAQLYMIRAADFERDLGRIGLPSINIPIPGSSTAQSVDPPLQAEAKRPVDTHALIHAAAKKHRVPAAFVKSIIAAESGFNCDAVSPKGAIGLMQLMPATAEQYGADPTIPEQNVDAGTHYLRVLMDKYSKHRNSLKRVIAAYNAGPALVDRYRGVPPFPETRAYVVRVLALLRHYEKERG
jgi:soluble lytic murein transglycosylase-like protein